MSLFPFIRSFGPNTLGDSLLGVGNNISDIHRDYAVSSNIESFELEGGVISTDYINVETQVPLWIRERNETPELNAKLVPLLQKYYDWLYSKNGSEYILDDQFANIKDIDNCPDELVRHFLALYAPDFSEISTFDFIQIQNIRNFLRSIQDRFYAIKGTEQSIAYFFITLFDATDIQLTNGFSTGSAGSYNLIVNFQIPPTNGEWEEIKRLYKLIVHPVGVDVVIERGSDSANEAQAMLGGGESGGSDGEIPIFTPWEIVTYGDGAYDGTGTGEEISIIGNYFPYTLEDIESIVATAGCSGSTAHGGITGGATGNTYTNMTTYAHPDWSTITIAGTSFGLINIYDFAFLNAASGNTYVNDYRANNNACPAGGYS